MMMLPGLGADRRLLDAQRGAFHGLTVPDWIEPERGESLAGYGRRMAEATRARRVRWIGGASFGGMVALEIARHLPVDGVILIGSCRRPAAISGKLRLLSKIGGWLPETLGVRAKPFVGIGLKAMQPFTRQQGALLASMLEDVPAGFVRWGTRAIIQWAGAADVAAPVYHIHGDQDRVIPIGGVDPDRVVHGAGHALSLTHPDEVNTFIRHVLAS
jgi:pimeloyl-ACP methyl ester carboxylesterase